MAFSAITSGHKNALALSLRLKNADGFQLQGNMLAHKLLLFFFFFFFEYLGPHGPDVVDSVCEKGSCNTLAT